LLRNLLQHVSPHIIVNRLPHDFPHYTQACFLNAK
jgi:hypothetical protein